MLKKRIVVVGAGYAGILTAKKLAKKLKKVNDVEITIIDKKPFHTMLTELHEVAAWRVEEDSIKISLDRVFAGRDVKVVLDTVNAINYDSKVVTGQTANYSYDYLVLATGSQPTFFGVPGAKENSFTLWSYEDAILLREHILNMFQQAACEPNLELRKKLLTFYVVGAGFTGVEMMGELAELVPILCDRFEIDPKHVKMVNVDALDRTVPVLTPKLSGKVQKRLEKMNVEVKLKTKITGVGEDYIELVVNDKTVRETATTVIWTAGIEGSEVAKASANLGAAGRGRVQTDEYLRSQNYKNVFIAGDNIFFIPEGEKMPVPQMVENCEACADTIAHNLIVDMQGKGEAEKYKPAFHGMMVCIGGRYGVAYVGLPGKFFGLPSFFAMLSKHFINIIYFMQVLGWNKIFSYIKHEFFTVRNCRSFLGGHFSNRSPSFLLVPLRLFLGFYWVYEGLVKVGEGWLSSPKLTGFFNGANAFYDSVLNAGAGGVAAVAAASGDAATAVATAAPVVEATTAASNAAGEATAAVAGAASGILLNFNFIGLFKLIMINVGEVAFKMQVPFVDWMVNTFIIPNDSMQMVFQVVIVLSEILIGLALMGGLFTTVAAGYSLILQMMFLTSTGLYMSSWWMIWAGVAMLFSGGRVLSLDYYVIPWLKKHWKRVKFVKKWYLYHD